MRYRRAVVLVVTLALLIAALWMAATSAQALVVPLSTKQLCDYSQAIVVATVTSMDSEWTGVPGTLSLSKATIMTEVRLRVLEVLKGEPVAGLTVQTPGGRVGDTEVTFTDAPSFVSDQSYVVFLDESLRVVGWREGALPVRDARVAGQSLRTFERRISASGERPPLVLRPRLLAQLRTTASVSRHASANVHASSGPVPVITAITPPAASVGTGAKVVLTGRNFGAKQGAAGRVQFMCGNDERIGAPIVSWSDTRIVCKVPTVRVPSAGGDVVTKSARSGPVVVRNRWSRVSKGLQFSVSFAWGGRKWGANPCTYRINANSKNGAQLGELVKAAIASWNNAGAKFAFVPEGTGTCDTTSYILDDDHDDIFWSALIPSGAVLATLALTNNHAPDFKTTTEFDMWFNDSIDKKWGDGVPGSGSYDVQSVALHELGHVLKLNDLYSPFDKGKVMYGGLDPNMQRRTLSDDDKAGIQWIYGKKSVSADVFRVHAIEGNLWSSPVVSEGTVVWLETRGSNFPWLLGTDITTGRDFTVTQIEWGDATPAFSFSYPKVVYFPSPSDISEVWGYDIERDQDFPVGSHLPGPRTRFEPLISGNTVVWSEADYTGPENASNFDVGGYDLGAGRYFIVCNDLGNQTAEAVCGTTVVWSDFRNGQRYLVAYDLAKAKRFPICELISSSIYSTVSVSGSIVVYNDQRGADSDVYGYDMARGQEFPICTAPGDQTGPAIDGDVVVWQDARAEGSIRGRILSTGVDFEIPSTPRGGPSISGHTVVWVDNGPGHPAIYGATLKW